MAIVCPPDRPDLAVYLARRRVNAAADLHVVALADAIALRAYRGRYRATVILALAPDEEAQIRLLDAGADDVVPRDSSDALIAARAAALLTRIDATAILRIADLTLDLIAHRAVRGARKLDLLPREYALLLHFARRPGVTVTRAELLEAVWGIDFDPGTNVIEVHVSRLRAKLDRGFATPLLVTEKGRGYRFAAEGVAPLARTG